MVALVYAVVALPVIAVFTLIPLMVIPPGIILVFTVLLPTLTVLETLSKVNDNTAFELSESLNIT